MATTSLASRSHWQLNQHSLYKGNELCERGREKENGCDDRFLLLSLCWVVINECNDNKGILSLTTFYFVSPRGREQGISMGQDLVWGYRHSVFIPATSSTEVCFVFVQFSRTFHAVFVEIIQTKFHWDICTVDMYNPAIFKAAFIVMGQWNKLHGMKH